jgi:hypothetical protein
MNNLEKAVKPILTPLMHGRTALVTPDQQLVIARWFVKTIIMYEFLGDKERGPRYFLPFERHALMRSHLIPDYTAIFLARYIGSKDIISRETRLAFAIPTADPNIQALGIPYVDGYTVTFAIKHLALQLVTIRRPEEIGRPNINVFQGNWDEASIRIWPHTGSVSWPPSADLDEDTFTLFASRWTLPPDSP